MRVPIRLFLFIFLTKFKIRARILNPLEPLL